MEYTRQELMAVAAAKELNDGEIAFIGTGLPMIAAYLAQFTHAPHLQLIFESGIIGALPRGLAIGVGDFKLVSHCQKASSVFDTLALLQAGFVDVGFLGAAEIDPYGNVNSTVIGDYLHPKVRLPGSGGANDIASMAKRVILIVLHQRRKLVGKLHYLTSPGFLSGGDARQRAGLVGGGPARVITDLAVMGFHPVTKRMQVQSLHPGVTAEELRNNTGFDLYIPGDIKTTPLPTPNEIKLLREKIDPMGEYLTPPTSTAKRQESAADR